VHKRRYYVVRGQGRLADFSARFEPVRGPSGDTFRKIRAQVPTVFGRLVYLSGLRDGAGLYSHPVLNELVGQIEADRTLCHCHHQVFSQWIGCTLAEQKADLDEYLGPSKNVIDLGFCRGLIPQAAHEVERLLYLTDLEMLLELRRFDPGGAFGDRGA
jgi:hypothetical protein